LHQLNTEDTLRLPNQLQRQEEMFPLALNQDLLHLAALTEADLLALELHHMMGNE
jgi:hypothetical protein